MKVVYLEWNDAFCNTEWMSIDYMKEVVFDHDMIVRQAGFLVKETKKFVVFAGSWQPETKHSSAKFTNIHKIPKAWIRNRRNLMEIK